MERDRLRRMLRHLAMGLPLAPWILVGCAPTQASPDAWESPDGFIPGPYCEPCASQEIAPTHRDLLTRGLSSAECAQICSALLTTGGVASCGVGGIGAVWSTVTGCEVLERSTADAGSVDAAWVGSDEDAGLGDGGPDPIDEVAMRMRCDLEACRPAGRRPGRVRLSSGPSSSVGAWLAEVAMLEAASVPAFQELRAELVAHRAPSRLVRATVRAERDEVLHAQMVSRLARRAGVLPMRAEVERGEPRTLAALAIHNAAEGCVRESYGALSAHVQSRQASDPAVRRAFARIARDEARHALLSLELDSWARPKLRPLERRRADESAALARAELDATFARDTPELRAVLGVPDEERGRELVALCA